MLDQTNPPDPMVSIVIPVFNEGGYLARNIARIKEEILPLHLPFEMILVDDGSEDNSWEVISQLAAGDSPVIGLRLSRNFGKEGALSAGLDQVKGHIAIIMDSDLQHPPELIPQMVEVWRRTHANVVEAVKSHRGQENRIYRFGARCFYDVLRRLGSVDLKDASDFKLIDQTVLSAWRNLKEKNVFFRGLISWMSFRCEQIHFSVPARAGGRSKWALWRLAKYGVDGIISFTSTPLHFVSLAGALFFVGALGFGIFAVVKRMLGLSLDGFTTVILLQLIEGSLVLIGLGIIGEYLAKIYDEVKARPRYLIAEKKNA